MRIKNKPTTTWVDYPQDGNLAVIAFLSGCLHNCKGCQNKELQDFNVGKFFTPTQLAGILIKEAKKAETDRIVLSGGDPLAPDNIKDIVELCSILKGFHICIYTGNNKIDFPIENVDYYATGKYDETKKEKTWGKDSEGFRLVSTNQRIYDKNLKLISNKNYLKF